MYLITDHYNIGSNINTKEMSPSELTISMPLEQSAGMLLVARTGAGILDTLNLSSCSSQLVVNNIKKKTQEAALSL